METLIKELGFDSEKEYYKLVSNIDISTPDKFEAFEYWKLNDGTKEGLLKIS